VFRSVPPSTAGKHELQRSTPASAAPHQAEEQATPTAGGPPASAAAPPPAAPSAAAPVSPTGGERADASTGSEGDSCGGAPALPTPRSTEVGGAPVAAPAGETSRKAVDGPSSRRVYGFDGATLEDSKSGGKKAISLRLEPLKPGLPAFERVLNEDRQSVTIGSKRGLADLVVVDEAVSKRHCVIALIGVRGELALSIVDHSTNGTFVNGKRVQTKGKRFRIRSGDRIEVKDASLEEGVGWKCDFGNTVSFFTRS